MLRSRLKKNDDHNCLSGRITQEELQSQDESSKENQEAEEEGRGQGEELQSKMEGELKSDDRR